MDDFREINLAELGNFAQESVLRHHIDQVPQSPRSLAQERQMLLHLLIVARLQLVLDQLRKRPDLADRLLEIVRKRIGKTLKLVALLDNRFLLLILMNSPRDCAAHRVGIDAGLRDIVGNAAAHRVRGQCLVTDTRHHDERQVRRIRA